MVTISGIFAEPELLEAGPLAPEQELLDPEPELLEPLTSNPRSESLSGDTLLSSKTPLSSSSSVSCSSCHVKFNSSCSQIGEAMTRGGEDFIITSEHSESLLGVLDLLLEAILTLSCCSSICSSLNCLFLRGISFFSISSEE